MHIVVKIPSLCKFLKKTWLYCVMPGSLPEPRKGSCKQVLWGVRKSLGNWTADISSKEDEGRDRGKERTFYFSLLFLPYILKGQCTWLFFWKNSTKPIWWGGGCLFVCFVDFQGFGDGSTILVAPLRGLNQPLRLSGTGLAEPPQRPAILEGSGSSLGLHMFSILLTEIAELTSLFQKSSFFGIKSITD